MSALPHHLSPLLLVGWMLTAGCETEQEAASEVDLSGVESDLDDIETDVSGVANDVTDVETTLSSLSETITALQEEIDALEETVTELQDEIDAMEGSSGYTDADALAAVQNDDPWTDPDWAVLENLWTVTDYGYQWLDSSRWTMDNRSDPPGEQPRHELIQFFHETPECTDKSTFSDCNSTGAMKIYANGPDIVNNDWSEDGYAEKAIVRRHTHASGLYITSFGQLSYVTDYSYGLIAPSGIHLEPHGAHQALRIDGTGNSGENIRIDISTGSKGIAIYQSEAEGLYCDELDAECEETHPLYLRGGTVHLEELAFDRTATDARNAGAATLHESSLGIEHFYSWHTDAETALPVHCTWNTLVDEDAVVKIQPYSTSPDLLVAHSYAIVEVWSPGGAPTACTDTQSIKTDAAGVYSYDFASTTITEGGFSVAILGPDSDPLYPGDWQEGDRPAFAYEVFGGI
jgi:hypothetical protein